MGEFKKGDEVRLIKSEHYNGYGRYEKTGELGKVIRYDGIDDTYYVDFTESGQWWAKASNLEPSAATLKTEAGKFYKTRDGRKVGPMAQRDGYLYHQGWHYNASGECCYQGRSGEYVQQDREIIAEWIDEPVAKASNDNAKPNFKVGDRVRVVKEGFTTGGSRHNAKVGDVFTLKDMNSAKTFWRTNGPDFYAHEIELIPATTATPPTTIVALIENGLPKPSSTPHVHTSTGAAEKEAKRLAAKYKGQQFGVFTLTTTHEEAAPVYDHKWQNMAYLGLKIDAIKELRAVAGLTLKGAKDAVEAWIEYENAA